MATGADAEAVGDDVEVIVDVLGDFEAILDVEAVRDATVPAARQITYLTHITHSIDLN